MRFGAGFARSGMTLTAIPIHISVQPYSLSGIDRGGANCGTTGTAACCCEWLQCRATEPLGALRFAGSPRRQFNVPGTLTLAPAGSTRRTRPRDFLLQRILSRPKDCSDLGAPARGPRSPRSVWKRSSSPDLHRTVENLVSSPYTYPSALCLKLLGCIGRFLTQSRVR